MPERDISVIATYKEKLFTATILSGLGGGSYNAAATVFITASPASPGKVFDKWIVKGDGIKLDDEHSEATSFTMPPNSAHITATYIDRLYSATVSGGTGTGAYKAGATVSLLAEPPTDGMIFDKWVGDGVTILDPLNEKATFVMPSKDILAIATYKSRLYTATVISGAGSGTYNNGATVFISAKDAAAGKEFEKWVSTNASVSFENAESPATSFIMPPGGAVVTATYRNKAYTFAVTGGDGGGEFEAGELVTVTAKPAPDGREFDRWASGNTVLSDPQSESTTFIMPANNISISALYKDRLYTLSVAHGSGGGAYKAGATVSITASPAPEGQSFYRWDGNAEIGDAQSEYASFTMPARDIDITAMYSEKQYAASISGGSGGGTFRHGDVVSISAGSAPDGKIFDRWTSSDDTLIVNPLAEKASFIMPEKHVSIAAAYKDTLYTLTVNKGSGGGTYKANETVYISANPAQAGMQFNRWIYENGEEVFAGEHNESATLTMPAKNLAIYATYKEIRYTLTVSGGSGGGTYRPGDRIPISADPPNHDDEFDRWISGEAAVENPEDEYTTFIMPEKDIAIIATYTGKLYDVSVNGGRGAGSYNAGVNVYITAGAAPEGQKFDRWSSPIEDLRFSDDKSPSASFVMPSQTVAVSAVYTDKRYTAEVTGGSGGGSYIAGETVKIIAAPAADGKLFDRWISSETLSDPQGAIASFLMPPRNVAITATYKEKLYALTVVNGSGTGSYKEGATVVPTASPAPEGQVFSRWMTSDNIIFSNAKSEYPSFQMPANDVTVIAAYKPAPVLNSEDDVTNEDLEKLITSMSRNSSTHIDHIERLISQMSKQDSGLNETQLNRILNEIAEISNAPANVQIDVNSPGGSSGSAGSSIPAGNIGASTGGAATGQTSDLNALISQAIEAGKLPPDFLGGLPGIGSDYTENAGNSGGYGGANGNSTIIIAENITVYNGDNPPPPPTIKPPTQPAPENSSTPAAAATTSQQQEEGTKSKDYRVLLLLIPVLAAIGGYWYYKKRKPRLVKIRHR
jgi:hypothetical protein